jgi:hypothetical protein
VVPNSAVAAAAMATAPIPKYRIPMTARLRECPSGHADENRCRTTRS